MTTAQVVETLVTVNNNSPIQDYVHPDDYTQPTFEMTPGFKPFTLNTYPNSSLSSFLVASKGTFRTSILELFCFVAAAVLRCGTLSLAKNEMRYTRQVCNLTNLYDLVDYSCKNK